MTFKAPVKKDPSNPPRLDGELVPWTCPTCETVNTSIAATCRQCDPGHRALS